MGWFPRSILHAGATLLLCSGAVAADVKLKAIRFPGSLTGTGGTVNPPDAAPLSQRIVFEFTGTPVIGPQVASGLQVTIDSTNSQGQPISQQAFGTYKVQGNKVLFTPRLPTAPVTDAFGPGTDPASNAALPGLLPATTYRVLVKVGGPNAVANLVSVLPGVTNPVKFTTVDVVAGPLNVAAYFANVPDQAPKADKKQLKPENGTNGVHPNVFVDPAGLFDSIKKKKRPPFKMVFRGPLDPAADNVSNARIRLRAIKAPDGAPVDLPLDGTPVLTKNLPESATVLLYPSGFLPLGHTLALEVSRELRALDGVTAGPAAPEWKQVGKYRVALDPQPGTPVEDLILEDFRSKAHQDASIAAAGFQLAAWDAADTDHLRATFGFGGDGSLGRFQPNPNFPDTITLDTDFQTFPLFDGSTPDALPGTVVVGGVFNFTEFELPANVVLTAKGTRPLVITATGAVTIRGKILLNGQVGTSDDTFDSAVTPAPGGTAGAGGGRGGDGHPVYFPAGATQFVAMQAPPFGQSGFGPGNKGVGGGGGQSGATLPWTGTSGFTLANACVNAGGTADGSRGSGGGGGSLFRFLPEAPEDINTLVSGRRGGVGIGNHLPVEFNASQPIPPAPQAYMAGSPGVVNAVARPNPNPTFAQAAAQPPNGLGLIYDQGPPTPGQIFFDLGTTWATTKRVTFGGAAGPAVFTGDTADDYIGAGGEVATVIGGQGGGGGGTRTEGLDQLCKPFFFDQGIPMTSLDSKGGGGGGSGGGLMIQALGPIRFLGSIAKIEAMGAAGGGGEEIGNGQRGGNGGGGSGGAVILQSAVNVELNDPTLPVTVIDVSGGCGKDSPSLSTASNIGTTGGESFTLQVGDAAPGGPGIVQIHVPFGLGNPGAPPDLVNEGKIVARVNASMFMNRCPTPETWTGPGLAVITPLVPPDRTPTPFTSVSVARSTWYDLGAVTSEFRPPILTSAGALSGPIFGIPGIGPFFKGTNPQTGAVMTDSFGNVLDPFQNDIQIDSPDLLIPDFIPQGPEHFQSVTVSFEGADEDPNAAGSPDLATSTGFVTDPTLLNGRRFVRWELRFNIATNPEKPPKPTTPLLQTNLLRVPFRY